METAIQRDAEVNMGYVKGWSQITLDHTLMIKKQSKSVHRARIILYVI